MVANSGYQWVRCRIFAFCARELIYGLFSVDGEWIVAKKDWQEAKRRARSKERRGKSIERGEKEREKSAQQSNTADSASTDGTSEPDYTPDMDEQRCILYLHGGKHFAPIRGPFCCPLSLFCRGILLRERGPGTIQHPAFRSEDEWTCVW